MSHVDGGRYLQQRGLTPQKPLTRAYEQNPAAVRRWLEAVYPALRSEAAAVGAEIHWADEMGFRSDYHAGRSYGQIRLAYLPGYSPDLNPDEFLNHDVKANAVGHQRPLNQVELIANVRSYLRITQGHPAAVRRLFDAPSVRYAAD